MHKTAARFRFSRSYTSLVSIVILVLQTFAVLVFRQNDFDTDVTMKIIQVDERIAFVYRRLIAKVRTCQIHIRPI